MFLMKVIVKDDSFCCDFYFCIGLFLCFIIVFVLFGVFMFGNEFVLFDSGVRYFLN